MKQGCVVAPTLFRVFFAVLLKQDFEVAIEGIHHQTRSDGNFFNLSRLTAKSKWSVCVISLLPTMQPSPPIHPKTFSSSWTVSGRPSKILGWPSAWRRHSYGSDCGLTSQHCNLETWTGGCQWLRISDTLSLKSELNKRIGKAATTISKLTKRVWSNKKLSWRKIPRSRSTELAFWAHCCTAASPGFLTHDRRGSLTLSTCAVSDAYLTSPGASWNSQYVYITETETFALARPCCENGWQPDPKESPLWRIGSRKAPQWQTPITLPIKLSARGTWRPWALTSTDGKPWLQNVPLGGRHVQQGLSEFEKTSTEQAETKRQTRKARNQGHRPATDQICSL